MCGSFAMFVVFAAGANKRPTVIINLWHTCVDHTRGRRFFVVAEQIAGDVPIIPKLFGRDSECGAYHLEPPCGGALIAIFPVLNLLASHPDHVCKLLLRPSLSRTQSGYATAKTPPIHLHHTPPKRYCMTKSLQAQLNI